MDSWASWLYNLVEPLVKRAAGMTPGQFRRLARGDRKILQEHLLNRRYA